VSERILVIKLGSFADMLLSMGELRAVDDRHPDAEIAVLTRKPHKRIYDRCPWVNEVIVDPALPRWRPDYLWRLGRELGSDFAYVFDLQRNRRTGFCRRWLAVGKVPWFGERGVPDVAQGFVAASSMLGIMWLRMLHSLSIQRRCSRVSANTLSVASHKPPAPSAIASCGGFISRGRRPHKARSQHSMLSLEDYSIASRCFSPPAVIPIATSRHILSLLPRTGM